MGARELLAQLAGAGLSVTAEGDRLVIRPASKLTEAMRDALRRAKPKLLVLLHAKDVSPAAEDAARTEVENTRFLDRHARLIRWGWADADARSLAERLLVRDREQDERVSCTDCRHYRPGHCDNHRRAGLSTAEIGRELAARLRRCPGHSTK